MQVERAVHISAAPSKRHPCFAPPGPACGRYDRSDAAWSQPVSAGFVHDRPLRHDCIPNFDIQVRPFCPGGNRLRHGVDSTSPWIPPGSQHCVHGRRLVVHHSGSRIPHRNLQPGAIPLRDHSNLGGLASRVQRSTLDGGREPEQRSGLRNFQNRSAWSSRPTPEQHH